MSENNERKQKRKSIFKTKESCSNKQLKSFRNKDKSGYEKRSTQKSLLEFMGPERPCQENPEHIETLQTLPNSDSESSVGVVEDSLSNPVKRLVFQIPQWVQKYFEYEGHYKPDKNSQRESIRMTCKVCEIEKHDNSSKNAAVSGIPYYNFKRHWQVGFVIGDNASNVKAAFNETSGKLSKVLEKVTEEESDYDDYEDFSESEMDESDSNEYIENTYVDVQTELEKSNNATLTKLPCFCHLLQLLIKDAITSNCEINILIKNVNTLKTFFHNSPYWYSRLKSLAGKGFIEQADTRWNTVYYVLDRLNDSKLQEALNVVLAETRKTKHPCRVTLSVGDYEKIKVLSQLLRPLLEGTNALQSNKVTSSLVIPLLSGVYKEVLSTDVGTDESLNRLKENLLENIEERFGLNQNGLSNTKMKRINRIAREDIFSNKNLVLATMLDPRFKSILFETSEALNHGFQSGTSAMNILESRYSMEKQCSGQPGLPHPPNVQTNVQTKQGSLLQHIAEAKRLKESNILDPTKQEIDRYMALPYEKEDSNPLDFWKLNESNFPILSKLARIYLGFPASSGSAERLFSISGALQRARRSRLKWSTIENILCYREFCIVELNLYK